MELRVLSGPQAGCRLPLGASASTYRAGGSDACDVVLEGMPEDQIAFVIYVGQRAIGLEALSDQVRVAGRAVEKLIALAPGQIFEFGQWLFAVDDPQAPWPEKPSAQSAAAAAAETHEDAIASIEQVAEPTASVPVVAESSSSEPVTPQRRKLPFWVIGLAATAAFLVCGVLVLTMSLAPTPSVAAATPPRPVADRLATLVAKAGGDIKVEKLDADRFRLTGSVATREQKVALTRDARAIAPAVMIQVNADEDLESLARDALSLFPQSGVEMQGLHDGKLVIAGTVKEARVRDQIVAALWDGVPGLKSIDAQVLAGDEVLTELATQLTQANLANRLSGAFEPSNPNQLIVQGALDEAARATWATVREHLQTRFGARLDIVEKIRAQGTVSLPVKATDSDVVAIIRGPIPYALLRDGSKRPLSATHDK